MSEFKLRLILISICILLISSIFCGCVKESQEDKKPLSVVVSINGEGDFTSIQEAIEKVQNGGTIHVKNGIYNEAS